MKNAAFLAASRKFAIILLAEILLAGRRKLLSWMMVPRIALRPLQRNGRASCQRFASCQTARTAARDTVCAMECWKLAVASTSVEATVQLVVRGALGAPLAATFVILAGDVVSSKKPDPEIYELAITILGTRRNDAIAIEDSRNGLLAADAAGLACVITESDYTRGEDFSQAALVMP